VVYGGGRVEFWHFPLKWLVSLTTVVMMMLINGDEEASKFLLCIAN